MRFQQVPYLIADIVALLSITHRNTSFWAVVPIIPHYSCRHYLAETTIQITSTIDESGAIVTTYDNLDSFVNIVQNDFPALSDYEISKFIIEYTGQDSEAIPEDDALEMLTFESITTSESYITVDENGETTIYNNEALPMANWTSTDGYMRISTNYGRTGSSGGETYYNVWALAQWLDYPSVCIEDAFALGTTGTFDDSVTESAYVHQTFKCNICNQYTYWWRDVDKDNTVDEDLSLNYDNFVPTLTFAPVTARCEHCGGYDADDIYFGAYIKYGLIADESVNIQAGYAHKTFGLGGISVSIGIDGTPSFSAVAATVTPYIARAVTVN